MVAHARQVFYPAASYEHDAVLLEVVTFAWDVGDDLLSVREADPCYLTESRVRLLGGLCLHLKANTASLGALLKGRRFVAAGLERAPFANQLVDGRHEANLLNISQYGPQIESATGDKYTA